MAVVDSMRARLREMGYRLEEERVRAAREQALLISENERLRRMNDRLVERITQMIRTGFASVPEEAGESFVMTDQHDLEVERMRQYPMTGYHGEERMTWDNPGDLESP